MSSSDLLRRWRAKERLPWVLWGAALVVAVPLGWRASGLGVAPAVVEVRRVALASPDALRVEAVEVRPGDGVKAGQVLARLDGADVEVELAIARAELLRLELSVGSREVELRDDRSETASRLAADAEKAALEVSRLVAEDRQDRSELAQLDEQVARAQKLVAEGLSRSDTLQELKLRQAALARKVEEFQATIAQARANAGATARRLDEWRAAARASPGGKPAPGASGSHIEQQVAPERAAADAQKERVRQLELVRGRLELKAPFDGRIGEVLVRPGEVAAQNAPVVTVIDDHPANAIAYVDERWAGRLRVGDRAWLAPADKSGPPRGARIAALGAAIVELPIRFRHFPTEPAFGREAYLTLDEPAPLPGQVFNATFHRDGAAP